MQLYNYKPKVFKLVVLGFLSFMLQQRVNAQIHATNALSPSQLVNDVLIGSGVSVSNVTTKGSTLQIASFTANASDNLGITSGIILSTGFAVTTISSTSFGRGGYISNITRQAPNSTYPNYKPGPKGPNNYLGGSNQTDSLQIYWTNMSTPSDLQLTNLVKKPNTTYFDAAVLEFDFIAQFDSIKFNFVLASEEYTNFAVPQGSQPDYNDVFAIFLSSTVAPVVPAVNIATLNISNTPSKLISIGNINHVKNSNLYKSNLPRPGTINSEYNGFTKVITCRAKVECGKKYHLKFAIEDELDELYDSAIFIEAKSLKSDRSGLKLTAKQTPAASSSDKLTEGCGIYTITLEREGSLAAPLTLTLNISGGATNNIDYKNATTNSSYNWPSSITFLAGESTYSFTNLKIVQDNITENLENINFNFTGLGSTACSNTYSLNVYLEDYTPVNIALKDSAICYNTPYFMQPTVTGGVMPYKNYIWIGSPPINGVTMWTSNPITSPTTFTLSVEDACNIVYNKGINITPKAYSVNVSNHAIILGEQATLTSTVSHIGGAFKWQNNVTTPTLNVKPYLNSTYTLNYMVNNCLAQGVGNIIILNAITSVTIDANYNLCTNNSITLTPLPNPDPMRGGTFSWSTGETSQSITVSPTIPTTYIVVHTPTVGFPITTKIVVNKMPLPTITVNSSTICERESASLTSTVSHGTGSYSWTNNSSTSHSISIASVYTTSIYNVTYSIENCPAVSANGTIFVNPIPNIRSYFFPGCIDYISTISADVTNTIAPGTYSWTSSTGQKFNTPSFTVMVANPITYSLVYSSLSCTNAVYVNTAPKINPTVAIVSTSSCNSNTSILSSTLSPAGGSYTWSTGEIDTPTIAISNSINATYSVNYTYDGCFGTASVSVITPTLNVLSNVSQVCLNNTLSLHASGGLSYTWSPSGMLDSVNSSSVIATLSTSTVFSVNILFNTFFGLCTTILTINTIANQPPNIDLLMTNIPCQNVISYSANSGGPSSISSINWEFDDTSRRGSSSSNLANVTHTYLSDGVYNPTLTLTDVNNCTSTKTKSVSILTMAPSAFGGTLCQNSTIALQAFDGTSYTWTPSASLNSNLIANPIATPTDISTIYTVQIQKSLFGLDCFATRTVSVIMQGPFAGFSFTATPCQNTITTANTTTTNAETVTYNWDCDDGSITSTLTAPSYTFNNNGIHTITLTATGNNNGCASTVTQSVAILTMTPSAFGGTLCQNGTVALNASDGTSYTWTPSASLNSNLIDNPIATPTTISTIYTVQIQKSLFGLNCFATRTVSVIMQGPFAGFSFTATPCQNTITTANTTTTNAETVTYNWDCDDGSITSTLTAPSYTFNNNGIHTITLTATGNNNGCVSTVSQSVAVLNFTSNIIASSSICPGFSKTLNVIGGTSYTWMPSFSLNNANIFNPSASPSVTTLYTVTINNNSTGANCINTLTTQVLVYQDIKANFTFTSSVCNNTIVTLNTSTINIEPTSYLWNWDDGSITSTLTAPSYTFNNNGIHTITLTATGNNNGCVSTVTQSVTVFNFTSNIIASSSICPGFSKTLNVMGGTSYTWMPSVSLNNANIFNPSASPSVTTLYTVTINNNSTGANCINTLTTQVLVYQDIKANFTFTSSVCNNTIVTLNTSTVNAEPTSYLWNWGDAGITSTLTAPSYTFNNNGIYTITLTATGNNNGCASTVTQSVAVFNFTSNIIASSSICPGFSKTLNVIGGTSYKWIPSVSLNNANIFNPSASPSVTTLYTVTINNNSTGANCINTLTTQVLVYTFPISGFLLNYVNCTFSISTTNASTVNAEPTGYIWNWNDNGNTSTLFAPKYTYNSSGTKTVNLTAINSVNTCSSTSTKTVLINVPSVNSIANLSLCINSSIIIQSNVNPSGGTYTWVPSGDNTPTSIVKPLVNTTYTLFYNYSGCVVSSTTTILVKNNATISVYSPTICLNDIAILIATINPTGGNLNWTINNFTTNINLTSPAATSTIGVQYIYEACSYIATSTVVVLPLPNVFISPEYVYMEEGDAATLTAISSSTVQWFNFGLAINTITVTPARTTIYCVKTTDNNNCTYSTCIEVFVETEPSIWIPNVFTPNSDKLNETFKVVSRNLNLIKCHVQIYNRYGQIIFESNDINFSWDGTYKGVLVKNDVYLVILDVQFKSRKKRKFLNHVTVLL